MFTLIFEGFVIGCLLGLTGAGGGILAVPALMTSQGWDIAQAAPVGLLAITLAAFVGVIQGLIQQHIRYKAAIWIALISIPAAKYGIYLAQIISPQWLVFAFSIVMFIVAYRIIFNKVIDIDDAPCKINQQTGKFIWNIQTASILGGIGLVAGLLTGLLGVGGGFIIVPAMRKFTNLNLKSIIATSLMVIFLIGSISISINIFNGFEYPLEVSITFISACVLGLIIGRVLIGYIPVNIVQFIFSLLVVSVSIYLLFSVFVFILNDGIPSLLI
ncbi:sulfite exporter TauE/SafE family protein [Providencia alcalifaciens]|uniref:sulfite exporter TauE/SafE family protein n=1 Tax=Providencia alcalifaciens TaxID=126385 RepID=UPI0015CFEFF0|nr:sulfite exporter TauE/SafE family protein [Providencia alcalifaciens]MBF0691188.1 sulfite exporter TauE/SafE family protein [Providencia alcalifaciens]NYS89692.1 sulfite exporter TauE/SafE family protein [Providencia alcalifaciens]